MDPRRDYYEILREQAGVASRWLRPKVRGQRPEANRAFSVNEFFITKPGALPQATGESCAFGAKQILVPVLR